MGFKKTEKGNLIYEFDFVPTKLVPMSFDQCGYDRCYAVEGANGERAPAIFEFQGDRHKSYAIAFGFASQETATRFGCDDKLCICNNQILIASFVKMMLDSDPEDSTFDPWGTNTLAKNGFTYAMPSLDEAKMLLTKLNVPTEGYDTLKQCMS